MNISNNSNCIDSNYKIIIPSKVRKRESVNVETNTEPWLSTCQSCLERENQIHHTVGDSVDIMEYAKAINYINSIHNFINQSMIGMQSERTSSGVSLNSSINMPDLPNFLTIFTNLLGLSKPEKSLMPTKSTSTTTLLPLCAALKRYAEQEDNQNSEQFLEDSETSYSRYRTLPNYYMDSISKTIGDQPANKSRLKLADEDSASIGSTSSERRRPKKINIKSIVSNASAKVDSHWRGNEKKYEYFFNRKFGKKPDKIESSKVNPLSEAEIDLYANQLLNETVGDCNSNKKKSQESHSSKSESINSKSKIARMPLERKKLSQRARDELPIKVREKPVTAIPVKKRPSDREKCKLKACNSESCHRSKSKRNLSSNWSIAQETADATFDILSDSVAYTTLECSMPKDERHFIKFTRDRPIMSFQLPSLTDVQMHCDRNREHKSGHGKTSITSLPNHITVALPHTQEKSNIYLTKSKNVFSTNGYHQDRLERKSSESIIADDQDIENCTDSDICDDMTDSAENTDPKTMESTRNRNCRDEFRQMRAFNDNAELVKFKNFVSQQCNKHLKYSDSLSNDTMSSDINSNSDLDREIIISRINSSVLSLRL